MLGLAWVSIAVRAERIGVVAAAIVIAIATAKTLRVVGWRIGCGIHVQGAQGCRPFVVTEVVVAVQVELDIQQ